jgi:DNA-binding CsgD family transcriptional regulator
VVAPVADFIELSRKVKSLDELSSLFESTVKDMGFHRWAYQIVNPPHDKERKPLILSNYPEKWVTHYIDNAYHLIDHVISKGPQEVMPFTWNFLCRKHGMTAQQKRFFNEASDNGLPDGLGVPVHGSNGGYAMVSMATSTSPQELEKLLAHAGQDVHIISLVFNTMARDLLDALKIGFNPPTLTCREKECLLWLSRGKTAWDIGHILGVSEAVVRFHLANARAKLGVLTSKEALVLAIMHKLIEP